MPGSCPRIKSEEGMTVEGVARGRALLVEDLVPILPFGVHGVDEPDLPGARPVLHRALALDRVADVLEALVPDEPPQPVCLREPLDGAGAVLPRAQREVGGHAEIERAVAPIAHQVHPAARRHGARTTTPLHAPPPSWPGSARPSTPSFSRGGAKTRMPRARRGRTKRVARSEAPRSLYAPPSGPALRRLSTSCLVEASQRGGCPGKARA